MKTSPSTTPCAPPRGSSSRKLRTTARLLRLKNDAELILGEKGFILLMSILVGTVSGAGAVILKHLTHTCHHFVAGFAALAPWMVWWAPAIPAVGIFGCIVFVKLFFRNAKYEKSLAGVITATTNGTSDLPAHKMYSHVITSGLAVGFGASAGLEAPIALTGAAIGSNFAKFLRTGRETRTLLLACGGGAGISAIFDSPVAGALFACEILLPSFSVPALVPLLIASASASVVSQIFSVPTAFIKLNPGTAWTVTNVPFYIFTGIACGLVSAFVIKTSIATAKRFEKFSSVWFRGFAGVFIVYAFFLLFPALKGEGYVYISDLLSGNAEAVAAGSPLRFLFGNPYAFLVFVALLFAAKPLVSAVCIESGGDGGIFGPSLFTGAFLGCGIARLLNLSGITSIDPVNCIAVGMGGVLAGVMHAPLTGMFLIAELTGGYKLFVPLMIVVSISSFISKLITKHNVYKSMIAMRGGVPEQKDDEVIMTRRHLRDLVEHDFIPVRADDTLRTLLKAVMRSKRNIFPVLDGSGAIEGVVSVDAIRPFILNAELYDVVLVYDVMSPSGPGLDTEDTLGDAAKLFERLRIWNLPVTERGKYIGFVSKAGVYSACRAMLREKHDLF